MELTKKELEVIKNFATHDCFYNDVKIFDDDVGIFDGIYFDTKKEALNYYNAYVSVCKKLELNNYISAIIVKQNDSTKQYYISN